METSQKEYPQFMVQGEAYDRQNENGGLEAFLASPAVYNRPGKIESVSNTSNGFLFVSEIRGRKAVHTHTHETPILLYKEADAKIEKFYLRLEIWAENIFRICFSGQQDFIDYYEGLPENGRMLIGKPQKCDYRLEEKTDRYEILTDSLTICVDRETSAVTAYDATHTLIFSQLKSNFKTADIYDAAVASLGDQRACFEALELETDEVIYGLGERWDSVVRNGRIVDFYNKDAVGTTSRRSYVNIPFFLSTKGYGLFLNSSALTDWQIGTKDTGAAAFEVLEEQMDYFVIGGNTPKDILKGYCSLTGFSQLPPLWSYGLWMSRNSYTSWDVVDTIAREVRENDIPCDVIHLDTAWFERDWNCDLKFSTERFPSPKEHIEKYQKDGFKISLWQYNFIPPNEDNEHYHEAVEHGYLVKNADGNPYHLPEHYDGSWVNDVIIDFSNPAARTWYSNKIRNLIAMGAGAIKTDFGEGIPLDARYEGIDGAHFHNLYSLVYNATISEATTDVSGEHIVWARSGTAGSQRYPLHWGGDSQCTFDALAATLRGALSIGISGIPFFSHDIGGFIGLPSDELYVRWAQVGLFSSHSRCHGVGDHTRREPWKFSKEACDIFRKYAKLRYSLMPYIYEQSQKCTETGLPMMRALYLEYPEDRNVLHIEDEYLFGDSLLIAPVLKPLEKTTVRPIYLPKGVWYDYFTREKIESSGMWIHQNVTLESLPIFVREGTVLEYCSADQTLQNGMGNIVKTEHWL